MAFGKTLLDELMDGGRVVFLHIRLVFQSCAARDNGLVGKREDLKKMAVKGDQIVVDQSVSGDNVLIDGNS
jgi:hypothetical protein